MAYGIPSLEELLGNKSLTRDTNIDPKLEYLNEIPFDLDQKQTVFIRNIFKAHPKTSTFSDDASSFKTFVNDINALIRKYYSIISRLEPFNQESKSIADINDWLKDLVSASNVLEIINRSEAIAPLLQFMVSQETTLNTQKNLNKNLIAPRSLIDMQNDIEYLVTKLEQLRSTMQLHVKTGRPKVDPMRMWFIQQLANLYEEAFKTRPTKTEHSPFQQLVEYLLEIIGDPLKDSFAAIKVALNSKQG